MLLLVWEYVLSVLNEGFGTDNKSYSLLAADF